MADTALETALRRDRIIILISLALITLMAWAYLAWLGARMNLAQMGAMDHHMAGPVISPWHATDFIFMFLMWSIMMVGMMIPSAAPMILIHAGVARQAMRKSRIFAPTGWFAAGYLFAWTGFAVLATSMQWALEQAALLSPMAASISPVLGGALLIAVGIYQWTPLKNACLAQCQTPLLFLQRHGGFRPDRAGALYLGLLHGAYCIGCCWGLMLLLFVGGVMNMLWIATIAIFVLAEKVIPTGVMISRLGGLTFIASGIAVMAGLL